MTRQKYLIVGSTKIYIEYWNVLSYFDRETDILFGALKFQNESQEKFINTEKVKLAKRRDKIETMEMEEREQESYLDHVLGWDEMIIERLEQQQRYSMVVSLFAFFEGRLKSICREIETKFGMKYDLKQLSGKNDILKSKYYLESVFKAKLNRRVTSYFNSIIEQSRIRNCIVHVEGNVSKKEEGKIKNEPGIVEKEVMGELKFVIENSSYIEYLLEKMKGSIDGLIIAVDDRAEELKKKIQ